MDDRQVYRCFETDGRNFKCTFDGCGKKIAGRKVEYLRNHLLLHYPVVNQKKNALEEILKSE